MLDLVHELDDTGEARRLASLEVDAAFVSLWPRLHKLLPAG
jgi:hypothetical protein